ncbi:hypothetical protein D3C83_273580 [compost metagenome]
MELVEADDERTRREAIGHDPQGIGDFPERLQLLVHVLHETVKVQTLLFRERQALEE